MPGERPIDRDLLLLGFPASRVGFSQISCVVTFLIKNDAATLAEVYASAAVECRTTAARVARNVHLMIDAAYSEGNRKSLDALTYGRARPADKEFLFLLAHYLRSRCRVA